MVFGVGIGMMVEGYQLPVFTLENLHPKGCLLVNHVHYHRLGALSGFHATHPR